MDGVSTDELIEELYYRRVSIETIFGRYYEMDGAGFLTVADAELAVATPSKDEGF